jgi:hypothetical protein
MRPAAVPEYMRKEAKIGQRGFQRGMPGHKEQLIAFSACENVQNKHAKAHKRKTQNDRRIIGYFQFFHDLSLPLLSDNINRRVYHKHIQMKSSTILEMKQSHILKITPLDLS